MTIALGLAFLSCRDYTAANSRAKEIWKEHRKVVKEFMSGQRDDMKEFESSLIFFDSLHDLTGVNIRANISGALGLVFPTEGTVEDMGRIDNWYEHNKNRIIWDEESSRIVLTKGWRIIDLDRNVR